MHILTTDIPNTVLKDRFLFSFFLLLFCFVFMNDKKQGCTKNCQYISGDVVYCIRVLIIFHAAFLMLSCVFVLLLLFFTVGPVCVVSDNPHQLYGQIN